MRFFIILVIFLPISSFAQADTTVTLVIKDKVDYSEEFLSKLKSNNYSRHYQLVDSLLIIGKLDTAYFPTDLQLSKPKIFSGSSKNTRYEITIIRINYTTIFYTLMIYRSNKISVSHKGYANIGAGFFLGSEIDEDENTGISYGSTEYTRHMTDCSLSIRIGKNDREQLCAKVKNNCKTKKNNIELDESPTLYGK